MGLVNIASRLQLRDQGIMVRYESFMPVSYKMFRGLKSWGMR
jgi:hypothetical protein